MGSTLSVPATDKFTESGGDKRFIYGISEMQGWRISMEDAHTVALRLDEGDETNTFFAVYDGHGGASVSKYAGENVHKRLVNEESYREKQYEQALKRAFLGTDEDMLADPAWKRDNSGCTAVAALVTSDGKIYVANAGDSRSVISVKGEAKPLSYDHKPQNESERRRIIAAHGYVEFGRVNGNLALSRALGDFDYKKDYSISPEAQIITADPDIIVHDITEEDEFLVLACDGIWDCLTSQEVINTVRLQISEGKELPEICENICELCLAPDTSSGAGIGCDNMTVLIVALLNGQTKEQWYDMIKDRVQRNYGYKTPDTLPQIYAMSRLLSFRARRQAREEMERKNASHEVNGSLLGGPGAGTNHLVVMVSEDESKLSLSEELARYDPILSYEPDSDEDDMDFGVGSSKSSFPPAVGFTREDSPDMTKSLRDQLDELEKGDTDGADKDSDGDLKMDEADDEALKEPFDSVIDLSQAEQDHAAIRANGSDPPTPTSSTSKQHPSSTTPSSSPSSKPLPDGDAKQVPEQLTHTPGGEESSPVVKAEGFLDASEDPLKG